MLYLGYNSYCSNYKGVVNGFKDRVGFNAVVDNYEDAVKIAADEFDLPYGYLMALIQLECGGKIPAGSRFEPHVFRRLKNVRDGKRNRYENVTEMHLRGASDDALRNLATSWGPFQLMGYKCILLNVKVKDIRGDIFADKLFFDLKKQTLNIKSFNNNKVNANLKLNEKKF